MPYPQFLFSEEMVEPDEGYALPGVNPRCARGRATDKKAHGAHEQMEIDDFES
jgi:hypothetical protein